jgi:hypothetical protein
MTARADGVGFAPGGLAMRIIQLALPLTVSSFAVAAVVFVACGGSSTNPPTSNGNNGNDGNDANVGSGDSGGSGNNGDGAPSNGDDSGSSNGDDSGGVLHYDAADIPDGGLPVTPNQIACGSTPDCDTQTSTCCISLDGGEECISGATASCPAQSASLHCLEAADCPANQVCCGTFSLTAETAASACQVGPCAEVQFCRTNGECENNQPCVPQTCEGQNLELCGLFSVPPYVTCTAN